MAAALSRHARLAGPAAVACLIVGVLHHGRNLHRSADRLSLEHGRRLAGAGSAAARAGLAVRPLVWALEFLQSYSSLRNRRRSGEAAASGRAHRSADSAGEEEGIIEKGDRELIQSVVAFGDKTVREVMTPRPRVVAIRQDATLEELRQLVINEQFSRIPVLSKTTIDQIIGFVHVRDMFELNEESARAAKSATSCGPFAPCRKPSR